MDSNSDIVLMDADRVSRSLHRMAHEIVEQNKDNHPIALFGINERGYAIAGDLADILSPMTARKVNYVQLFTGEENNDQSYDQLKLTTETFFIVVDDVIFSGRTMFTALKKVTDYLDPSEIHTAVLVDRGHRKFPVQAEFCGMNLPTKPKEHVLVNVENNDVKNVKLTK